MYSADKVSIYYCLEVSITSNYCLRWCPPRTKHNCSITCTVRKIDKCPEESHKNVQKTSKYLNRLCYRMDSENPWIWLVHDVRPKREQGPILLVRNMEYICMYVCTVSQSCLVCMCVSSRDKIKISISDSLVLKVMRIRVSARQNKVKRCLSRVVRCGCFLHFLCFDSPPCSHHPYRYHTVH